MHASIQDEARRLYEATERAMRAEAEAARLRKELEFALGYIMAAGDERTVAPVVERIETALKVAE